MAQPPFSAHVFQAELTFPPILDPGVGLSPSPDNSPEPDMVQWCLDMETGSIRVMSGTSVGITGKIHSFPAGVEAGGRKALRHSFISA